VVANGIWNDWLNSTNHYNIKLTLVDKSQDRRGLFWNDTPMDMTAVFSLCEPRQQWQWALQRFRVDAACLIRAV